MDRICSCMIAWAMSMPAMAFAKAIEVPTLAAAQRGEPSVRGQRRPDSVTVDFVMSRIGGIADQRLTSDAPDISEGAVFDESEPIAVDVAAIPLDAKLATVAALELLEEPKTNRNPATGVDSAPDHR